MANEKEQTGLLLAGVLIVGLGLALFAWGLECNVSGPWIPIGIVLMLIGKGLLLAAAS